MKNRGKNFYSLLVVISFLILEGILVLASTSTPISLEKFGTSYYYLTHQLLYGFLPGLVLGIIAFYLPLTRFKKYTPYLLLATLFLVGATFIPALGLGLKGANRWLRLGPISFQPTEFLKISFVLYWAYLLAELKKRSQTKDLFIAFWVATVVMSILLLSQPDMSTLVILIGTSLVMYFVNGASLKRISLIVFVLVILAVGAVSLAPYRLARLLGFFHAKENFLGSGYQLGQQILAIGSGGVFGRGLGFSRQKFGFLPHSMSDSIFAIISEETGLVGSLFTILLFLLFTWLGFKVSRQNSDAFSQILGVGIVTWIDIQAAIHIGANLGLIPVSGIPLPFISYGGSALAVELIAMGFLLNVAKHGKNN